MKKICWLLLLVCSLVLPASFLPVQAAGTGTITVELTDSVQGNSPEGVRLQCLQIASLENGRFSLLEPYTELMLDVSDFEEAQLLAQLEGMETDPKAGIEIVTDASGQGQTGPLDLGLYWIRPVDLAGYDRLESFLVILPFYDVTTGEMETDVICRPKHLPWPVLTIQKMDAATNEPITGNPAIFGLYEDEDCQTLAALKKGNSDGMVSFIIPEEKMYLKEFAAPEGYLLSDVVVLVEQSEDGLLADGELKDFLAFANHPVPEETVEGAVPDHTEGSNTSVRYRNVVLLGMLAGLSVTSILVLRKR